MLSQRGEELRSQRMLQNYNENYSELNYHQQVHMPPTAEYNSMVNPIDQSWYNSYNLHGGGMQNGGVDYYGRGSENKSTSDWSNYHSDPESPFMPPPQINNNSENQYSNIQPTSQMMGQQMQIEGSLLLNNQNQMMVPSNQEPLMINQVHNGLLTNDAENSHVDQVQQPPSLPSKEEETLSKIDSSENILNSGENQLKEGTKDGMRLPGFHQTFGNITEIGRFSQHDDYFESRPNEVIEEPKVCEPVEPPAPKRKPRGRKRKQPEQRDTFPRPNYGNNGTNDSPIGPPQCMQQEMCSGGATTGGQWQYQSVQNHHHPSYHDSYHGQWRTHPYYHQQHYHHHHYAPPPPPPPPPPHHNMYYQHYNDCLPYHHYNSYPNNWHMNRDYIVHNYPSYV
ncbi:hypothetical protein O3M35_000997 [Rhynocoris fuscipes]|uniref:Uncharacterized protein n=1 Tax=Rhynocoris fuscipes TaxID=488301 RepID=A0AAW1DNP2_9HEMI